MGVLRGEGGGAPPLVFAHQNVSQQVFFLLVLGFCCKNRSFIPGGLLLIHGPILNFPEQCTTLCPGSIWSKKAFCHE